MKSIRIATRQSPLALCQSELVRGALLKHSPSLRIEIAGITTTGDRLISHPLADDGGKALFVKELEQSLLEKRTDIAVHSMKDVPAKLPDGLCIGAVLARGDPSDALVCRKHSRLNELPPGSVIGTSSLRRQCQIKNRHPGLRVEPLRGNVGTRLRKLDEGLCDAVVLACAGLARLGIKDYTRLPHEICLPAIGQGAIGIECRADDAAVLGLIRALNDPDTARCVGAERAVSRRLGADCRMPLAASAHMRDGRLHLDAVIGDSDGGRLLRDRRSGARDAGEALGLAAACALLDQGADRIIAQLPRP